MQMEQFYYYPAQALEKLKKAQAFSMPVYIYGATGAGKSALIDHFLADVPHFYFSVWDGLTPDFDAFFAYAVTVLHKRRIVVIDDLNAAAD